jgi:hypothetical protein
MTQLNSQRRGKKLLLTILNAVYIDIKKTKSVIAIKPKLPFKPVFQVEAFFKGSIINTIISTQSKALFQV